jgi:tetratricopeptide (TPR) repeat protein
MEDANTTRAMNAPANAGAPKTPLEPTQAMTPPAPGSPEPTQAFTPPPPPRPDADALLSDEQKRRQIEAELARLGMTSEEVRRLLLANAYSTDPAAPSPAPPAAPGSAARSSPASMESLAAELLTAKSAERVKEIEQVNLNLPEFRESTLEEIRQAETLLREASMLRRRERFRDAEAKCRESLALVPKDAAALELLGDLLQGVARTNEALAAYRRATEADPKRSSAERKYGDLLMRQQNWGGVDMEAVPKNGFVAVLLSALLPGAGQLYNGDWGKGLFFLLATAVCVYLLAWSPWGFQGEHRGGGIGTGLLASCVLSAVLYIAALVDANVTAKQGGRDRRRGVSSGWDV